jgi:hypothetical protein
MQDTHELYDLNSGRVITRARVTQIPITDVVIKAIKRIAEDQGFKSLKFKNRKGAIFHDAELEDLNEDAREEDNPNQHQEQDTIKHDDQDKEESKDKGTAVISKLESDSQTSEVRRLQG